MDIIKEAGSSIDEATFEQILEMDDDDDREFSKGIVFGYLEQAEATFKDMDNALEEGDLQKLSSLGHFLKGSSATLGLNVMKDSCEKIQHLGERKNDAGDEVLDEEYCLNAIPKEIQTLKNEYVRVERTLKKFYAA